MTQLIPLFINNLLPIFLIAGVGYLLGKTLHIEPRSVSQVIFFALSPCLLFDILADNGMNGGDMLLMTSLAAAVLLSVGLLTWLVGALLRLERKLLAAVTMTAMLPNAGNLGLSVVLFAFGEKAVSYASLYFVASAIVSYTAGIFVASSGSLSPWKSFVNLFKVPMIYAVILALLFHQFSWTLPVPLERSVSLLGQATIPMMIFLLGLQFQHAGGNFPISAMALATGMRLLVSPAIGYSLSLASNLQGSAMQAFVLESSVPSAVTSTMLATQYDVEPSFVANVVFMTTLLSPLTITPILAFLGA